MRKCGLIAAVFAGIGMAMVAEPAWAGGALMITESAQTFAEDVAGAGPWAVVLGIVLLGVGIMTGMFLILTLGIATIVGGALASNAVALGTTWFPGGAGGGDVSGYVEAAVAHGSAGSEIGLAMAAIAGIALAVAAFARPTQAAATA